MLESLALKAVFGAVKDWFFDALSWVAKHPWQAACVAFAVWLAWLYIFTLPGLEADIDREARSHAQTKENYRIAQNEAAAQWEAATAQWEQDRKDAADEADKRELEARSDALDAAERFIARNRVQCPTGGTLAGSPSPTSGTPESGGAEGDNGPSAVPELVGVHADDVRICTINTTRLQAARKWSATLE